MMRVIRPATPEDDARCGVVLASALSATSCAERLPHARFIFADDSPLSRDCGTRLVAEDFGMVVGFIDFNEELCRTHRLYVHADWQGQGIGSALLNRAERACGGITYVSTPAVNDKALRWYLTRGYRIVGGELEDDWHGGPTVWIEFRKGQRRSGESRPSVVSDHDGRD
jgi:GNAT superfamily N-acetyltransferase